MSWVRQTHSLIGCRDKCVETHEWFLHIWATCLKLSFRFPDFVCGYCVQSFSRAWLFVTPWTVAHQAPLSMGFFSKITGVGGHFLLRGIFPTQGWTRVSRIGRQIHYHWLPPGKPLLQPHLLCAPYFQQILFNQHLLSGGIHDKF